MKKIRLFCFSYAGGSATVFLKWRSWLADTVELIPVELAGRGTRFSQPLYTSMEEAVEDVYLMIKSQLKQGDYGFFGHSMGTCIIFELCRKIRQRNDREPLWLFLSGRCAPHVARNDWLHRLPDARFLEAVYKLGGASAEFMLHPELQQLFTPILKADHRIVETYQYVDNGFRLHSNLTIFYGLEDHYTARDITAWEQLTTMDCFYYPFGGGHFFIHDHCRKIVEIINQQLKQAVDDNRDLKISQV